VTTYEEPYQPSIVVAVTVTKDKAEQAAENWWNNEGWRSGAEHVYLPLTARVEGHDNLWKMTIPHVSNRQYFLVEEWSVPE
jgi:hypothetical protein